MVCKKKGNKGFSGDTMIIPIFSNIIVMTFYTVLNIGIIIVSPLNPLFPFFLHTIAFKSYIPLTFSERMLFISCFIHFFK